MKKIFSLVALVGMFALMSFGTVSTSANQNNAVEKVAKDCFQIASDAADAWMDCTGGSFDDSWCVFDAVMASC